MSETPLLHKPVSYGSEAADLAFVAVVALHAALAGGAVVAGVVALAAKKGGRLHRRVGAAFLWGMVGAAVSGIGIDVVRLTVRFGDNHTSHAGMGTPSSIPARIAFLYAGLCVLYLARRGWRALSRPRATAFDRAAPPLLALLGLACGLLIVLRLNPWTGALWMIATFVAAVAYSPILRRARPRDEHRFHLLFLAAFSWWGAAQGFGPAVGIALRGVGPAAPYVGDRPGSFSPAFFGFLALWLPAFALAAWMLRRYARRHG